MQQLVEYAALHLCGVELGDGGGYRVELAAHMAGQAVVDERAQHGALGNCVRQLEARVLEIHDAPAKRLALLHVVRRCLDHAFQAGGGAQCDGQALLGEFDGGVCERGVLFTQAVVHRHAHVVEKQLAGVLRMLADLAQRRAA
ncbi:hypothetical protein SDC9_139283 [bioreactor metagenome]|uniref:Uncharacterized protein n=1 Tax=bioreactor metagenome TaxID=1076179 RepID=A0A645DSP2_9ZZZZ